MRLSPADCQSLALKLHEHLRKSVNCEIAAASLLRPLSKEAMEKVLKVSYGSIVPERRRYFRCPVQIPVLIQDASMPEISSTVVNISAGGSELPHLHRPRLASK